MSAGRYDGQTAFRACAGRPKSFDTQVQDIASAAHLRGIVLMKGETVVGSLEAAELCKGLRAAHENTRGQPGRHEHVVKLANGISARLGVKGAVQVSNFAWNLIKGYAHAIRTREQAAGAAAQRSPESLHGSSDSRSSKARKVRAL